MRYICGIKVYLNFEIIFYEKSYYGIFLLWFYGSWYALEVGGMLVKPEAVIRVVLVKPEAVTRADYRNWDQMVCAKIWARRFIFKSICFLVRSRWIICRAGIAPLTSGRLSLTKSLEEVCVVP